MVLTPNHAREHNVRLFRFLVAATIVFCVIAAIMYWQQNQEVAVVPPPAETVMRFSKFAGLQEPIEAYRSGAKIISDIESYPEIRSVFFEQPYVVPSSEERLREVQHERTRRDGFAQSHVYHTSYYIGNLLVRGNETLDGLLRGSARPQTSVLLETVLADVRAGSLALQTYFDQPTPAQYDPALAGALYYTTPSFPSLTMTEVAAVLYILADLDIQNAAVYEHSLHQFINQLFSTGAHFRSDIEYALKLAEVYYQIIQREPAYTDLFTAARSEWEESVYSPTLLQPVVPRFIVNNFPSAVEETIVVVNNGHTPLALAEELEGELRLSLVDLRIPNPVSRLYEYSLREDRLLPVGSELVPREYPALEPAVMQAQYQSPLNYLFATGPQPKIIGMEPVLLAPSRIILRVENIVERIVGEVNDKIIRQNPEQSFEKNLLLFTEVQTDSESFLGTASGTAQLLSSQGVSIKQIPDTDDATFILSGSHLAFLRGNTLMVSGIENSSSESVVATLPISEALSPLDQGLQYIKDAQLLIYHQSSVNIETGIPSSQVLLLSVTSEGTAVTVREISRFTLQNQLVTSTALSPGGKFVAVTTSETFSRTNPKVLIFDTMSGIIQKDIPLTSFAVQWLLLDAWTLF